MEGKYPTIFADDPDEQEQAEWAEMELSIAMGAGHNRRLPPGLVYSAVRLEEARYGPQVWDL